MRDWREDARFGVAVLVLVAVVAGFVWYRIGIGGAGADESTSAAPSRSSTTTTPTADESDTGASSAASGVSGSSAAESASSKGQSSKVAVHVAGAVTRPGVVELAAGSRVIDAVEAVGGALPEADLDRLNLAAKVVDGERVYVAKAGEADPGVTGVGDADAGTDGSGGVPGAKVNLNTASEAQLEGLPGIGPTYAQAIVAERQRRGGFKSVNELRTVHGIGDKRFAELAPLVTV